MGINSKEYSPKVKEYIHNMNEIIDWAKASIEEEFSQKNNSRIVCFKWMVDALETYQYLIQKHTDSRYKEYTIAVEEKFETLKREIDDIYNQYPGIDVPVKDEEKDNLFRQLSTIKEIIHHHNK